MADEGTTIGTVLGNCSPRLRLAFRFLPTFAAAVAAVAISGALAAPTTRPTRSGPVSRPAIRTPDATRDAVAPLFIQARGAAEKGGVKTVVALSSLGSDSGGRLRAFLQETLLDTFDGGPALVPPPAAVRVPPKPLNPAALGRLRWQSKGPNEVPTVLAAIGTGAHDGTELSLTLLDGKQVFWHGSVLLRREEIAALPLTPPLNWSVLRFAIEHRDMQVGNGECWTLADEALKAAGASHPDTYVWGRALGSGEPVIHGDIVQFTSVRLENGQSWMTIGTPAHTAIIERVNGPGEYVLIHQNFGGRTVKETPVDLGTKTAGEFVIYRPLPGKGRQQPGGN